MELIEQFEDKHYAYLVLEYANDRTLAEVSLLILKTCLYFETNFSVAGKWQEKYLYSRGKSITEVCMYASYTMSV